MDDPLVIVLTSQKNYFFDCKTPTIGEDSPFILVKTLKIMLGQKADSPLCNYNEEIASN